MKKSERIIAAVLIMLFGILLIAIKDNFIGILMTVGGVFLIALGVVDIVQSLIPPAVIKMVVGVLVIVCGWAAVHAVLYVVSALLLIAGILLLYDKIKNGVNGCTLVHTICEYAVPAVCILMGILLFFHSSKAVNVIFISVGILGVVEGGLVLFGAFNER